MNASYAFVYSSIKGWKWPTAIYNESLWKKTDEKSHKNASQHLKKNITIKEIYIIPKNIVWEWWDNNNKTAKMIRPSNPEIKPTINQRISPKNACELFNSYEWIDKTEFSYIEKGFNTKVYVIWTFPIK